MILSLQRIQHTNSIGIIGKTKTGTGERKGRQAMYIELKNINLSTSLLGIPLKTPIIQAPMAAQGLAHEAGELATARGMAQVGSIFSLSTYGNKTIEDVSRASEGNPFFFQLYMSKNNKNDKNSGRIIKLKIISFSSQ